MSNKAFPIVPGSLLFSCMRNEGSTVLEWFAYHRVLGFENFLIYTNDCEDGTDAIWERLTWLGLAVHRGNPQKPNSSKPAQKRALHVISDDPVYRSCDWALFLDADEFLNITGGDGSLQYLLSLNEQSDCVFVNWRLFGSSGQLRYEPGLITERFVRAHDPKRANSDGIAQAPKSLFRRKQFLRPGIHRPQPLSKEATLTHTRPSGKVASRRWTQIVRNAEFSTAQINHYATQSLESVFLKVHRGRGAKSAKRNAVDYLNMMNHNHTEDRSIQRIIPAVKAQMDKLLADPVLNRLQREAETWRTEEIRKVMTSPEVQTEFDMLASAEGTPAR